MLCWVGFPVVDAWTETCIATVCTELWDIQNRVIDALFLAVGSEAADGMKCAREEQGGGC